MSNDERVINGVTGEPLDEVELSPREGDTRPYMFRPEQVLVDQNDRGRMIGQLEEAGFRLQEEPRPIPLTATAAAQKATATTATTKVADESVAETNEASPSDRRRMEIERGVCRVLPDLGLERWVRDERQPNQQTVPQLVGSMRGTDPGQGAGIWPVYVAHGAPDGEFGPATTAVPTPLAGPAPQGSAGKGVRIGVVDTGLFRGHEWLQHRAVSRGPRDDEILDDNGDKVRDFEASHGSFIAGVILSHAPGAVVIARAALDSHGIVDDPAIADAIDSLLCDDIDILNLSLGGYVDPADPEPFPATFRAIRRLRERNSLLVVVAAAGNDGLSQKFYPAASRRVIGVGALTSNLRRACFSNFGSWVDAWANGVDVESCFDLDGQEPAAGAIWSGTSFAAPRVAGAIAAAMNPA